MGKTVEMRHALPYTGLQLLHHNLPLVQHMDYSSGAAMPSQVCLERRIMLPHSHLPKILFDLLLLLKILLLKCKSHTSAATITRLPCPHLLELLLHLLLLLKLLPPLRIKRLLDHSRLLLQQPVRLPSSFQAGGRRDGQAVGIIILRATHAETEMYDANIVQSATASFCR